MNLISRVLHNIGKKEKDAVAIQIGAMDGIQFDDTRGFFDMYKWKSILIEPIPQLFEELKHNLKDRENLIFEQCAIAETDGFVEMLTVPPEIIKENDLHPGYKGMSAMFPLKNGFGSDYHRDIEVKQKFGKNIKVPSLTMKSLLRKHKLKSFDILVCDAEGYDWVIFKQLDLKKIRPKFVRLEFCNLTDEEKRLLLEKLTKNNYEYEISGQNIDAVTREYLDSMSKNKNSINKNMTIVTGLWNIHHHFRSLNHYIENFKRLLDIPQNLFIYIPKELEHIVWEKRSPENTYVKIYELENIKHMYNPFWDRTQNIRNSDNWKNLAGWLKDSSQSTLQWYNPIVQSKMFLLNDVTIWNPFNTEYFFWLDAGIMNTVPYSHLVEENCLQKLTDHSNPFLFLSYPYQANTEIHGFEINKMNQYAGKKIEYVCRGGLFGGHKQQINQANATYYALLDKTLNNECMGTEESLFTIMAYNEPNIYRRFELDGNGLIVKFTQSLINNDVKLSETTKIKSFNSKKFTDNDVQKYKTNLYILTFNFPQQLLHTINSMKKTPEWLKNPNLFLIDNSTKEESKEENKKIAAEYNFQYIDMGGNTGICGGRQKAAEHFHESDADFMFFFEDDMTVNPPEYSGQFCRNGFRKYIPNLYNIVHKIMLKDEFDFLKLTFTEVYFDNDKQCSWYNVPQNIRSRDWPDYDKLPVSGLDPNVPLTNFKNIKNMDGVCYIDGEIYYANWPMIVSKSGNKKMFIDTKWAHPYEQTWMSYMYQMTKEGNLKPAILLASPIWHDRIAHYKPEERREN
jgi:FkbM family methyltransferase